MRHLLSHGASKTHNLSFFNIEKYAFHTRQTFFHTNFYQAQITLSTNIKRHQKPIIIAFLMQVSSR
jgi:hypothetical protein